MLDVFISYAFEDSKEAAELHRLLTLLGFNCFLAHKDIRKGDRWRGAILKAVRSADVFIPLLSGDGLASAWVQQECGMAHVLAEGKKRKPMIIPVLPAKQTPPGCLSEYQSLTVGMTWWKSKLTLDSKVACSLGAAIVERTGCLQEVKTRVIEHLYRSTIADFCVVVEFLHSLGEVGFNDFLFLIKHAAAHDSAFQSDQVMSELYSLLKAHIVELGRHPDWVAVWNGLHNRSQAYKAEVRRRQEENARKLQAQMEAATKMGGAKDRQ
jgi:hypothetical protein